jgi:hypothetical protein
MTDPPAPGLFPSEDHRRGLCERVHAGGFAALNPQDLREFHAYRYAWRRMRLGDFTQSYGCDPQGEQFDGVLVGRAVEMYRAGSRWRRALAEPPPPRPPGPPSAEDVAHVEWACREIRRVLAGKAISADDDAIAAQQAALGMTTTREIEDAAA